MKQVENIEPWHIERIRILIEKCHSNNITLKELDKELASDSRGINSFFEDLDINRTFLHYIVRRVAYNVLPVFEKYIDYSLYNTRDSKGETPIMAAIDLTPIWISQTLVESQKRFLKNKGYSQIAIEEEIIKTINMTNDQGTTPLHYAAEYHKVEHIKFLVSLGADSKKPDRIGHTPLFYAAFNKVKGPDKRNSKIEAIASLVKNVDDLYEKDYGKSYLEILRQSNESWGDFQEQELLRAANKATGITSYCTIS